jgi:DNA (cytosine-5)-methyltransferase 1
VTTWYNEIDPFSAGWLRALIAAGEIAPGVVDERDIRDVRPADLDGFDQLHFFAGIGTWSYALRRAGWPDDRPVWTGSCPCQPFSAAGGRTGFADERHLWPAWHYLVAQRRPAVVLGEQVASGDGLGWLDLVQADLEDADYACGALDSCSAGFGAPHIRQRLWFVAQRLDDAFGDRQPTWRHDHSEHERFFAGAIVELRRLGDARFARLEGHAGNGHVLDQRRWFPSEQARSLAQASGAGGLADARRLVGAPQRIEAASIRGGGGGARHVALDVAAPHGADRGLADADQEGRELIAAPWRLHGRRAPRHDLDGRSIAGRPGPVNGHWADADWIFCRDGRWRPIEPGSFPLAHGVTGRVGRLRGYGNAINAEAAAAFVRAAMQCL